MQAFPSLQRHLSVALALALMTGGCGTTGLVTPVPTLQPTEAAATAVPAWISTPTPTYAPTPTPSRSPTPAGLHGRIVFVRDDPVPNLWVVYADGSGLEQLTFDPSGAGVYVASETPPYLVFASITQPGLDADWLQWIPLPDGCSGVTFSPTGRYVTCSTYDPETSGCEPDLHVLDAVTLQTVATIPSSGLDFWLTDTLAMVAYCYCEGCDTLILNAETGNVEHLGGGGVRYWSPDQMAFVTVVEPYPGAWRHLWAFDVQEKTIIRPEWEAANGLEDSPCWTPGSSYVVYTRQPLTFTDNYTITIGPRQVRILDRESGDERVVLGDAEHDYFVGQWETHRRSWSCTWQGDWLQVWSTPHQAVTSTIEPFGDDWEALQCTLNGQNCPDVEFMALNWHTGEILPWEEAPLPTTTAIPPPTPMPGPNLAVTPICTDPGGASALYPGPNGVGLWRVPPEGEPTVVVEDGHHFFYIP
jgi:hypothetical protein